MQWFAELNNGWMERLFGYLRLQNGTSVNYPPGPVEELAVYLLFLYLDIYLLWLLLRTFLRAYHPSGRNAASSGKSVRSPLPGLLLALLLFVLLEASLRCYVYAQPPPTYLPHPLYLWHFPPSTRIVLPTPVNTMQFTTNSLGLRDEEVPLQKAADEFRIVCLGDSATFAQSIELDKCYEKQLQRMLAEAYPGRKITVINAGVPGFSMLQGYYFFCEVASRYQPDLVVVNEFNEFSDSQMGEYATNVPHNAVMRQLKLWLWDSMVYLTLRKSVTRFLEPVVPRTPHGGDSTTPILTHEESVYYIKHFIQQFEHRHVKAIFALWRRGKDWEQLYAELLKDAPGIVCADYHFELLGRHGRDFWLPNDPSHHPSVRGHRYMARAIFNTLRDKNLVPAR